MAITGAGLPALAADPPPKPIEAPASDPFNDRLSVTVGNDGRFSEGAFPGADGGYVDGSSFTTLYGWPWTGTSFTTVRIDGADYIFGSAAGTMVVNPADNGDSNDTTWAVAGVSVKQHLQLVLNPATGKTDTAQISYTAFSYDSQPHSVGVRVMFDTDVNYNDGAPFRIPGMGAVTTEQDLTGSAIPDTFQVFQDLADSAHVAAATLRGAKATPPDRVVVANWRHIYTEATPWDFTPVDGTPITGDSAYAVYWNPIEVSAAESRTVTTYYGLSDVTVNLAPPVALGVTGPAALTAVDGGYSPSPFTVSATVSDSGTAPADNVVTTLNLPAGLHSTSSTSVNVGTLTPGGGERIVSWQVTPDIAPAGNETIVTYSVTVTATGAAPKTVSRNLFLPRTDVVLPKDYVALGDSYQSGEGAYDYRTGTDVDGTNMCHRSNKSYPYLVGADLKIPNTTSVACSGAVIANLDNGQWNEPAQYDALSPSDTLVTVGIGGNDLGFSDLVSACAKGPQLSGDFWRVNQTCNGRFDQQVNDGIAKLSTPDPATGLSRLGAVYSKIRERAPFARIVVVGYPKFFPAAGNRVGCNLIWRSDEIWINAKIKQFDDAIENQAHALGAEYAAGAEEFSDGHALCDSGTPFLNGVIAKAGIPPVANESFHPNVDGHRRIADLILGHIKTTHPANTFPIGQGQTITSTQQLPPGTGTASFLTTWPGSDVVMSLTDPAGHQFSRSNPGTARFHSNGRGSELFTITDPVPGAWTVTLYGAQIAPGGENVTLDVQADKPLNKIPVAAATIAANAAGTTVTYDGRSSADPDGRITGYEWDFGDGTTATGPVVTHTFTNLGYLDQPTLIVTDDRGDQGFRSLPPVKVHYGFDGFRSPLPRSGEMRANAGRTIPVKWALTAPDGSVVSDLKVVTGYSFDTQGATFDLSYDTTGQQYVLLAKTPSTWSGQTHTLTVTLDDNSVHTQVVKF